MRVIVSASSDIGFALGNDWLAKGYRTIGTFRSQGDRSRLENCGFESVQCDLANSSSVRDAIREMETFLRGDRISHLVMAAGSMLPIGKFSEVDFQSWCESIEVNFLAQAEFLHLSMRNLAPAAKILFFAGGGTNSATSNFSAYTLSKIASIKLCELLAFEYPEFAFFTAGPGWVNTKIHLQTLRSRDGAGEAYKQTVEKLSGQEMMPMQLVIERLNLLFSWDNSLITGRNFSLVHDFNNQELLLSNLRKDPDHFKLRRFGNGMLAAQSGLY